MNHLTELYQEVILDHNKAPRNFGQMADADRRAEGHNPLCGDKVTVYIKMQGDRIEDVRFDGSGCAISTASASIMTETVKGKTREDAARFFELFHQLVMGGQAGNSVEDDLGSLAVFHGVSRYPVRVKCATLAWHTLNAALKGGAETISTE